MTAPAIDIQNVSKRFGATHAVRNLELQVPSGSLCGFLGPNGAGKSTTIRMIMSIIYPDSGSIRVLGSSALARKDDIGYLPEERGLYRRMKVADFLNYMARLKGMPSRGLGKVVQSWLERVDLPDVGRRRCQELSKGMQQKIQFVAAVINDPALVILDEPFSGLDPVNANLLNRLIRELRDDGRTIIFSTHVLHQAELICDRIFLINDGEKLLDASVEEIRTRFDPHAIEVEPLRGALDIEGIPGIDRIADLGERAIEVFLTPDGDPTEVMRAILDRQPVRSIRRRQVSLEETFVSIVGGRGPVAEVVHA